MIIYFDTETTGLTPGQICQLSYVLEEAGRVERKNFYFKVKYVEPGASAVTGLTKQLLDELSGGQVFSDRAEEIHADFACSDLIIAHNFRFDYAFMQEEFSRLRRLFEYRRELCTMRYFTPVLKLPRANGLGYKYPKLTELCSAYRVSEQNVLENLAGVSGFHNSAYDAEALYLCVSRARAQYGELNDLIGECI